MNCNVFHSVLTVVLSESSEINFFADGSVDHHHQHLLAQQNHLPTLESRPVCAQPPLSHPTPPRLQALPMSRVAGRAGLRQCQRHGQGQCQCQGPGLRVPAASPLLPGSAGSRIPSPFPPESRGAQPASRRSPLLLAPFPSLLCHYHYCAGSALFDHRLAQQHCDKDAVASASFGQAW